MKRHRVGAGKRRALKFILVYGRRRQYRAYTATRHEAVHAAEEIHDCRGEPTMALEKTAAGTRVIKSFGGKP